MADKVPRVDSFPTQAGPKSLLRKKYEQKQIRTLTQLQPDDISKVFETLAAEGQPLNRAQFKIIMEKAGRAVFKEDAVIDALWNALDRNGDQSIEPKELVVGLATLATGDLEQKLRFGFKIFDLNRDGSIQRDELRMMVTQIARIKYAASEDLSAFVEDFVTRTFAQYDANKDGQLSFEEIVQAAKGSDALRQFFTLSLAEQM